MQYTSLPNCEEPRGSEIVAQHNKLQLYRMLRREVDTFPMAEMRKKLRYNVRFVFELYRDLDPADIKIQKLMADGQYQLNWLRSWRANEETCKRLIHKAQ